MTEDEEEKLNRNLGIIDNKGYRRKERIQFIWAILVLLSSMLLFGAIIYRIATRII